MTTQAQTIGNSKCQQFQSLLVRIASDKQT